MFTTQFSSLERAQLPRLPPAHVAAMKVPSSRGRRKMWSPRLLTAEDMSLGQKFVEENQPTHNLKTSQRVQADYLQFCDINCLVPSEGLVPFIGQMLASKLKEGTIEDYVLHVSALSAMKGNSDTQRIVDACKLAHGEANTKSACDADDSTLIRLIRTCRPEFRATLWLHLQTGLRHRDLRRLKKDQILFSKKNLRVLVKITKGRRSRTKRSFMCIPWWFLAPPKSVLDELQACEPGAEPTTPLLGKEGACYCKVQREIKRLDERLTTYTFRRAFINRAFEESNGDVNLTARNYTLHRNPEMLSAFYLDWKKTRKWDE